MPSLTVLSSSSTDQTSISKPMNPNFSHFFLVLELVVGSGKGKSPGVPFNRITSQYSQLEKFEFLRQFSKAAEKT